MQAGILYKEDANMRSDGELIIGTVVMSMPEYGAAKVVTCGGAATIKEPILCYLPYSDANCGSLIQNHILHERNMKTK